MAQFSKFGDKKQIIKNCLNILSSLYFLFHGIGSA